LSASWSSWRTELLFKALDDRSARIKAELDEALKLRKEAEGVSRISRRQGEAEKTAESIILNARVEADRMAAEAQVKLEEFIARRTKMAETKIRFRQRRRRSPTSAAAAADVAIAAAEAILVKNDPWRRGRKRLSQRHRRPQSQDELISVAAGRP